MAFKLRENAVGCSATDLLNNRPTQCFLVRHVRANMLV